MTIEMIPDLPDAVVGFVAKGQVTKEDYTGTLEPALKTALAAQDKVALLYVLGEEFTGYSGKAMWEDAKIGTESMSKWEKIAVVSDTKWVSESVGLFGHLMPSKIKVFSNADEAEARAWVGA